MQIARNARSGSSDHTILSLASRQQRRLGGERDTPGFASRPRRVVSFPCLPYHVVAPVARPNPLRAARTTRGLCVLCTTVLWKPTHYVVALSLWLLCNRRGGLSEHTYTASTGFGLYTSVVLYPKIRGKRLISVETSSWVAPSRSCQQDMIGVEAVHPSNNTSNSTNFGSDGSGSSSSSSDKTATAV